MQKSSINNGIFLGIALLISTYVLYWANTRMFFSIKGFVLFTIFLLIILKSGREARTSLGGFIDWKTAFINMFITGAIGYLFVTVGEYVLYNFVDTGLADLQKEISLEALEEMSGMLGGSDFQDAMEKSMEEIEDKNIAGAGTMFATYIMRLIAPVGLMAAIVALIIRKKGQPMDDLDDNQEQRYIVNN